MLSSMAYDQDKARQALGILGNIASCLFFLSSVPTVASIIRKKSSGGLSGDLYLLKLFNCLLWIFYGLPVVRPHNFWVLLTNSFGCAFALMYILPYMYFASGKERLSMLWKLALIMISFIIMVVLLLVLEHSRHNRVMIVGILCAVVSSSMHLTLLSQTGMILQTKNVKYLHPKSSMAAFLKGAIWTAYGIASTDLYILIPNGVGIVIGCIQLLLVVILVWTRAKTELINEAQVIRTITIDEPDKSEVKEELPSSLSKVPSCLSKVPSSLSKVPSALGIGGLLQRQSSVTAVVVPIDEPNDGIV